MKEISPSHDPREKNGEIFNDADLLLCQKQTWDALHETAASIQPGWTEKQAKTFLKNLLEQMGAEKYWHPPQIRFGKNTLLPFGKPGEDVILKESDIFFLDIGPLFNGYEGDAGQTFVVGDASIHQAIVEANQKVFLSVKRHWEKTGSSGQELYDFATSCAADLGYILALEGASGHRIGDFPHNIHHRGKLKGFDMKPAPNRWILEIHLVDSINGFGAFHEDIL